MTGDAEQLPFQDNSIDAYTIAFGIRNVTHIDAALVEAYRVGLYGTHNFWMLIVRATLIIVCSLEMMLLMAQSSLAGSLYGEGYHHDEHRC